MQRPHESMMINPGFNRDPLKPKEHHILMETAPGQFSIVGKTREPLPLIRINLGFEHAVHLQDKHLVVLDEEQTVQELFEHYTPPPQAEGEPPTPEKIRVRNRWLDAILRFLLPGRLFAHRNDPDHARKLGRFLRRKKIDIALKPPYGDAVIVYRNGAVLASWG